MLLESEFLNVWISGEISNLVKATSGHWYFSLKDNKAQIKGAMFRGNNRNVRAQVENGTQVLVRGRLSLYEPRGDYQLIVELMEPAGEGLLKQEFEALKNNLLQMGLFDQSSKQAIPVEPKRVGLVTSPTGAAVHDILTVLQRRSPQTEVIIYPTMVQGKQAADNIMWAINTANVRKEVDVLIVGRGGGSLEDLWCFNDEGLAHTIFNSAIPIISAVGHEVDVSISDFVADLRAPTPSAAAEIVSTDNSELVTKVRNLHSRLIRAYAHQHQANKNQQNQLKRSLALLHPSYQLQLAQQKNDELQIALHRAMTQTLKNAKQREHLCRERLNGLSPKHELTAAKQRMAYASSSLPKLMQSIIANNNRKFVSMAEKLNIVSPLATLTRGYSITTNEQGNVISDSKQVKKGEVVNIRLANGELNAKITDR
ncbi:exodeoxyribonuclease VII large subunit [Psychrosphaera aestuarii]|uniref:exodeoxyribonuclease VII large subunit n=1 Tax=Psychrosphaera aestuarii TaxID=1266052 RepID=UPI001FD22FE5|nr:exodeoxyribonuclease VII large subunit [Psychrosphaera aestuarii]